MCVCVCVCGDMRSTWHCDRATSIRHTRGGYLAGNAGQKQVFGGSGDKPQPLAGPTSTGRAGQHRQGRPAQAGPANTGRAGQHRQGRPAQADSDLSLPVHHQT